MAEHVGIRIFDIVATGGEPSLEKAVIPALELLRRNDPKRFARVRKHLPEIFIVPTNGAEYLPEIGIAYLGVESVRRGCAESLALLLVHEGTHGWLHHRRVQSTLERHQRIEELCIREELRFARTLEDPLWAESVSNKLSRKPTRREEHAERLEELEAIGMPKWFLRMWWYVVGADGS